MAWMETVASEVEAHVRRTKGDDAPIICSSLCGRETGPRLPTLLLALGTERVRRLLVPPR